MSRLPELASPPDDGRVFHHRTRAGLGDVSPSGRARLDAVARWLQDAASEDWADAGLDDGGAWVVRRLHVRVERFPRFGEPLDVQTFCSGTARLCAERRSTLRGTGGALVEAVAVRVHLDLAGHATSRWSSATSTRPSTGSPSRGSRPRSRPITRAPARTSDPSASWPTRTATGSS